MKTRYIFLTFISLFIFSEEMMNYPINKEVAGYGKWEMVKSSHDVQTYVRWVKTSEGTITRERKGEMIIECTVDDVTDILTDSKSSAKWMRNVKESFELKRLNRFEWYNYTLFNIPWPFENRDLVSFLTMKTSPDRDRVDIHIISEDEYIPHKSRIERLTNYIANWSIIRVSNCRIKITFSAITNAPPMFPRWIQDPVVENLFHNNLIHLKAYILLNKQ
jgi:hypothetical protein